MNRTVLAAILCTTMHASALSGPEIVRSEQSSADPFVSTFSIVALDSTTGEIGIAVASRFFAVGSVVPWARADVGAVATQSFANTSFGWRGLDLIEAGLSPAEVSAALVEQDDDPTRRQFGIVSATGESVTYTGTDCIAWAGGRRGPGYAIQGNILAGEEVVLDMESAFLRADGTLADRLYAALVAGEQAGGDSRGKQSAALLVVKAAAGYGGYTDRAIDIRVDDHEEPFVELGRLLSFAQINYSWNEGWTAYTRGIHAEALGAMERTAALDPDNAEVLYDLAVVRLAAGDRLGALDALKESIDRNPALRKQALDDSALNGLRTEPAFKNLTR
jgi:uncharacterized Ntn-hydrolase superfamily protein